MYKVITGQEEALAVGGRCFTRGGVTEKLSEGLTFRLRPEGGRRYQLEKRQDRGRSKDYETENQGTVAGEEGGDMGLGGGRGAV